MPVADAFFREGGKSLIVLDFRDRRPIYEQIEEKLKELMMKGVLEKDSVLPSVRSLAVDLSINPNTIQRAYRDLEKDGWIYTIKGRGSFVSGDSSVINRKKGEVMDEIISCARKAKDTGIEEKDIIKRIHEVFSEEEKKK